MQRRERVLMLVVAGLGAALALGWGAKWAIGTLQARQAELKVYENQAADRDGLQAKLDDLKERRARLDQRSLVPDIEPAKTAYTQWLRQLVSDPAVNFAPFNIQAQKEKPDKGGFTRLAFTLDGEATYPQFIRFLQKFYAADHLHKITALKMPIGKDQKKLHIDLSIEALVLPTSQNKETLSKLASPDHPADQLQADVAQLLLRHFYRANQPPKLTQTSYPATVGGSLRISLAGSDPDDDKVSYAWVSGPDWLKLEGNTLVAKSVPEEKAYEVVLSLTDDGVPPKSVQQKLTINAKVAKVIVAKKKLPFDHLKFTFLEGLVDRGNTPEAKVTVRTLGEYHTLHVGDEKQVGGVKIKVLDIDPEARTIEVQLPDNTRRKVELGKSLGQDEAR